jgi:hypothetical protein
VADSTKNSRIPESAKKGSAWIARLGSIFWGFVQVAVPGGLGWRLFHNWLKILYAFEALLLIGSTIAVADATQKFAIMALVVTVTTHLLVMSLSDLMKGRKFFLRLPVLIVAAVMIGLMGVGAWWTSQQLDPFLKIAKQHVGELKRVVANHFHVDR